MQPINWRQFKILYDTQANIEARTDVSAWSIAIATDRSSSQKFGYFNGTTWEWVGGGGGGGAVDSVNGDTGVVILDYADVGADPAGSAATAEANAKVYADGLVVGLWDDRGSFDASGGSYPSSGGSGTAGAILKGDAWTISVSGTLPTGQVVEVGDFVRALVDTPGNTQANWAITQNNIGYVAENSANKATSMAGNETSNILYLTAKAVYDWAVGLFVQKNAGITGATKTKITYDAKGLVTTGADATAADVGAVALSGSETINGVKTFSSDPIIPDEAYGVGWDGSLEPPTKNAIYDKIENLAGLVVPYTNANDVFRCDSPGGVPAFVGTIATLPGGAPTTLTYNVTSGKEGAMVPFSTSQLAKMRLYNTTRGTYALISNCNTGTNTLTFTANVPAGWVVGDVISITSQYVIGSGFSFIDLELVSSDALGASAIHVNMQLIATASFETIRLHPSETFSASKYANLFSQVANIPISTLGSIKLINNLFSFAWTANVTQPVLRISEYVK